MGRYKDVSKNHVGRPCCYCKRTMGPPTDYDHNDPHIRGLACTVEHLEPRSFGGTNEAKNLVGACQRCNNLRGHLNYDIFVKFSRHVLQAYPDAPTVFLRASLQRFVTSLAEIAIRNNRETNRAISHALLTLGEDLKRHGE